MGDYNNVTSTLNARLVPGFWLCCRPTGSGEFVEL
jgi:hypothetical protein